MSTQDKMVDLLADIKKLLKEGNANWPPNEPRGIIGGSLIEALPYLDGWNYVTQQLPGPKLIRRGETPQIYPDWKDEEGWVISGLLGGTDPDIHLKGTFDNLNMEFYFRQARLFSDIEYGSQWFKCNCYDPTIPLYSICFGVTPLAPYNKRTAFNVFLDPASIVPFAFLTICTITKIIITDRKSFFSSMKKLGLQQSVGKREVNVRI